MGRIIGIDLGTTNSVGAYWSKKRAKVIENDKTQSYLTPSVVAFDCQGNRWVGQPAKDRAGALITDDMVFSIKRLMGMDFDDPRTQTVLEKVKGYQVQRADSGDVQVILNGKAYKPVEISALILQQIKADAEVQLGETVTHAVITVPAYFSQRQKDATREAGRLAGLHVARIINEPTAAALAFGLEESSDDAKYVLVYDLGGGTFDVSILLVSGGKFDVFNIDGDNFLGGDDFDNVIIDEIIKQLAKSAVRQDAVAMARLKYIAEQVKIDLSRSETVTKPISFQGGQSGTVDLSFTITRARFEQLIADQIERSVEIVKRALAGANLEVDEISHVLLVGGSTRIPLVRNRLKTIFGEDKIEIDVDPMQCVALGAAVQGAALLSEELAGEKLNIAEITGIDVKDAPKISITDVTSKHIGIEIEGREGKRQLHIIVPKTTIIPTVDPFCEELFTSSFDQQNYRLTLYEIESPTLEQAETIPFENWERIGVVINDKVPPGSPKGTPVMVELQIDRDGILTVASYVKNAKVTTLIEKSLHMGGNSTDSTRSFKVRAVGFHGFMFHVIANDQSINRYLESPEQLARLRDLSAKANQIVENGAIDAEAEQLLEVMHKMRDELPVPIEDIFFAYWICADDNVSTVDRSQANQHIMMLDRAVTQGDIDTANQHLATLRQKVEEIKSKLPSGLLSKYRG